MPHYEIFHGPRYMYSLGVNENPREAFERAARECRNARMVELYNGERREVENAGDWHEPVLEEDEDFSDYDEEFDE